jgi:hypothetical protein
MYICINYPMDKKHTTCKEFGISTLCRFFYNLAFSHVRPETVKMTLSYIQTALSLNVIDTLNARVMSLINCPCVCFSSINIQDLVGYLGTLMTVIVGFRKCIVPVKGKYPLMDNLCATGHRWN